MLHERFGSFWKEKQVRKPAIKNPEDVHDEHTDQVMHHLQQIHKLTGPSSDWHRAIHKMGGNSKSIRQLHKDISGILSKYAD